MVTGRLRAMSHTSNDPLEGAMRPPRNETADQKQARLNSEFDAKRRSELLDRAIREEQARKKKERIHEKTILLLGQANAGKTTILKQMRMLYAAEKQAAMRRTWVDVIYLNVILAIKLLLEAMEAVELTEVERSREIVQLHELSAGEKQLNRTNSLSCLSVSSRGQSIHTTVTSRATLREPNKIFLARLRLAPFLSIEAELRKKLGSFEKEPLVAETKDTRPVPQFRPRRSVLAQNDPSYCTTSPAKFGSESLRRHQHAADLLLRAGWQDLLLFSPPPSSAGTSLEIESRSVSGSMESSTSVWRRPYVGIASTLTRRTGRHRQSRVADETGDREGHRKRNSGSITITHREDDPSCLLSGCLDEVKELWEGPCSSKIRERLCGADSAEHFLNNVSRFARADYVPVDEDILHARVRTVGATEEHFIVDKSLHYRIIDVGGSRTQRNVWAPYFDDATAIIFLAPISAFDEYLEEAPEVNRVTDSLDIWRQIVFSPLLLQVSLILFLNKMDLFRRKIDMGIQIKSFFSDYDGANKYEHGWRYFRSKFHTIVAESRSLAPTRALYVHKTTATSTKEIKVILISTRDAILRHHLKESGFAI